MCGEACRASECLAGRRYAGLRQWLGPGNTNVIGRVVVPGIAPSQYHPAAPPRVRLPTAHRAVCTTRPVRVTLGHAHMTVLAWTKEILGVGNARARWASC